MFNFQTALLPWNGEQISLLELQKSLAIFDSSIWEKSPPRSAFANCFFWPWNTSGSLKSQPANCASRFLTQ